MKMSTVIGLGIALLCLFLGPTMEGAKVMAVINPPAMLIVFGGTLGAVIAGTSMAQAMNIPKIYKMAMTPNLPDLPGIVHQMVGFAEAARRDGLLALDEKLGEVEDEYMKKGLQLVVDGTDADLVAEILEAENAAMKKRHKAAVEPFDKAGGYAPTMGIIGTVFGLVHVLENLSQPETLGPLISSAFIATLLGVASANVVYLPVATRMKGLSADEIHARQMIIEGVLSIQAGDNPRVVGEKLMAYVPPALRGDATDGAESGGAAGSAEQAAA